MEIKPKKLILHIAPTPFFSDRGCHIRIEGVVNCLANLGFDNLVCTYHHGRDVDGIRTSRISTIKNYTKTEAGPSKYKLWADLKLLFLVLKEVRRNRPSVIHAHLHEGLMIALVAKCILFWKRIPLVADMQGSLFGELESHGSFKKRPYLKWPVKWVEASLMFFARRVVCSSSHSLDKFKSEFGLSEERISLVQDGAQLADPISEAERNVLLNKYQLPKDTPIVVYSGALLDSKGLNELQMLIKTSVNKTRVHFLIIGYPVEGLRSFLLESELSQFCTLTGQVDFCDLSKLLQLADLAVDPKFNDAGEGSGKMLNYLACGLPVLAFSTQNNKDFLPVGSTLFGDVSAMAEGLKALADNKSERERIGKLNKQHFIENYSWAQTQQQLDDVYQTI